MSIASEITRLQNAKEAIKTSLTNKGITVPEDTTLEEYSTLIDNIEGSTGTMDPMNYYLKEEIDKMLNFIVNKRINGLGKEIEEMLISSYDSKRVTGAQIKSFISKYNTKENMILEVKATTSADYLEYGMSRGNGTLLLEEVLEYNESNEKQNLSKMDDSSDTTNYVPASAKFTSELIKSFIGNVIVGVRFTRSVS